MKNPLTQFYLFIILAFGAAGLLTFFPAAAAPFFSAMWKIVIITSIAALGVSILLFIVRS